MKHIQQSATIRLNAPPDVVLPLFTPVGEHYWIEDWNPTYVYPDTGEAATGTIFKTKQPSSALQGTDSAPESIWVTVTYDPARHIAAYISVTPDVAVVRVDIRCETTDDNITTATIRYSVTALGEGGLQSLQHMTEAHYQTKMLSWEQAINHYLEHGKPIFQMDSV